MAWVYILRGSSGRHYIGSCVYLHSRFAQHLRGHTATTERLGGTIEIVAKKSNNVGKRSENRARTKTKEKSAARNLSFAAVEQPRKLSGLVGSSNLPPCTPLLFRLRKIGLQVLVAAVDRSHEADAVVFRDCTDPAFLMNITPPRKC